MLTKDTKLRFWCQKVLPLVYDDSLSYYELLNKVVLHLNQHTEDINALIDFYATFSEDIEEIIMQMLEDGDFNEIIADTVGSLIAEEYDPTKSYIIFEYCIYESKLYRANGSTTGVFNPEKWDERTVGYDLTTIQNYIYSLNAGNVLYDASETYSNGTVGKELNNIENSIAIVSINNTHAAIAKGQYVYIKNHSTLADGLYRNNTNAVIPQNEALSTTNVAAVSGGGLNEFVGKKLTPVTDALFSTSTPVLMEASSSYDLLSGILPINNYYGFIWVFYPSETVVTANKITLNELLGLANTSHYSVAISSTGQIKIRHALLPNQYEFNESDSTLYLHRIYGLRYEIN